MTNPPEDDAFSLFYQLPDTTSALTEVPLRMERGGATERGAPAYSREIDAYLRRASPLTAVAADTIGVFVGTQSATVTVGAPTLRSDGRTRGNAIFVGHPPLGLVRSMRCDRDRIVSGYGDAPEFRVYLPNGALLRIVRWGEPKGPAVQDVRRTQIARLVQPLPGADGLALQRALDNMDVPKVVPYYISLHVDPMSRVWIENPPTRWNAPVEWSVFDDSGTYAGVVRLPPKSLLLSIGEGEVMVLVRDDKGGSRILVYDLSPP